MSDFAFSSLGYSSVALVAVGLIGLLVVRFRWRRAIHFEEGFIPISEWRPTGHIDFVTSPAPSDVGKGQNNDGPLPFILRAEDYRMLESMAVSGAKRLEFRWRAATLVEARHVVAHHNSRLTAIDDYLPSVIRNPHIVPPVNTRDKPPLELSASKHEQ